MLYSLSTDLVTVQEAAKEVQSRNSPAYKCVNAAKERVMRLTREDNKVVYVTLNVTDVTFDLYGLR